MNHPDTAAPEPATQNRPNRLPWGAITHGSCTSWWTGASRAHCPACHRTFSCDSAADEHRTGRYGQDRHCVDPAGVGLVARERPYGVLWGWPGPEGERAERLAEQRGNGAQAAAQAVRS
jgi:hypothetical protein